MKEKEEDEERNDNICPQAHNQSRSNSKTEATLSTVVCGSSGSGPIVQYITIKYDRVQYDIVQYDILLCSAIVFSAM